MDRRVGSVAAPTLYASFTPDPEKWALSLRVARTFVATVVREEVMNSWQTWLLFRPLIVFVMACPSFVFAVVFGLRKKPSEGEQRAEGPPDQSPRFRLSASGTWRIQADCLSPQPLFSNDAVSATQKRAA